MVENKSRLDEVFKALSDSTRRAMLADLRHGAMNIGDLGKPHDMSFAGAAKHVKVLERAGLVTREKRGRQQFCHLRADHLCQAHAWLETYTEFWNRRLDALEAALNEPEGGNDND